MKIRIQNLVIVFSIFVSELYSAVAVRRIFTPQNFQGVRGSFQPFKHSKRSYFNGYELPTEELSEKALIEAKNFNVSNAIKNEPHEKFNLSIPELPSAIVDNSKPSSFSKIPTQVKPENIVEVIKSHLPEAPNTPPTVKSILSSTQPASSETSLANQTLQNGITESALVVSSSPVHEEPLIQNFRPALYLSLPTPGVVLPLMHNMSQVSKEEERKEKEKMLKKFEALFPHVKDDPENLVLLINKAEELAKEVYKDISLSIGDDEANDAIAFDFMKDLESKITQLQEIRERLKQSIVDEDALQKLKKTHVVSNAITQQPNVALSEDAFRRDTILESSESASFLNRLKQNFYTGFGYVANPFFNTYKMLKSASSASYAKLNHIIAGWFEKKRFNNQIEEKVNR